MSVICVVTVDRKKITTSQEKVREKRFSDEPIDLDALVKDYNSPSCILLPTIEASRHDLQTTPFKVIQPGTMGIAIKEMPANEVSMVLYRKLLN